MSVEPWTYTDGNAAMKNYKGSESIYSAEEVDSGNRDNIKPPTSGATITYPNRWYYARFMSTFTGADSQEPEDSVNRRYTVGVSEAICFKNAAFNAVNKLAEAVTTLDDNYRKDENKWNSEHGSSALNSVESDMTGKPSSYMYTYGGLVRLTKQAYPAAGPNVSVIRDSLPTSSGKLGWDIDFTNNSQISSETTTQWQNRYIMSKPYFMSYLYDHKGYSDGQDSYSTTLDTFAGKSQTEVKRIFNNLYNENGMLRPTSTTATSDDYKKFYCIATDEDVNNTGESTLKVDDDNLNDLRFAACFNGTSYHDAYDWTCHDYTSSEDEEHPKMELNPNMFASNDSNASSFNYNEICNLYYKDMYAILFYLDSMFYSNEPCLCPGLPGHDHKAEGRDYIVSQILHSTFNTHQFGTDYVNEGSYNFKLTLPLAILPPGGDLDAATDVTQSDCSNITLDKLYNMFYHYTQYAYGVYMIVDCDYGFDSGKDGTSGSYEFNNAKDVWQSKITGNTVAQAIQNATRTIDGRNYVFGQVYKRDFAVTNPASSHLISPDTEHFNPDEVSRYSE